MFWFIQVLISFYYSFLYLLLPEVHPTYHSTWCSRVLSSSGPGEALQKSWISSYLLLSCAYLEMFLFCPCLCLLSIFQGFAVSCLMNPLLWFKADTDSFTLKTLFLSLGTKKGIVEHELRHQSRRGIPSSVNLYIFLISQFNN